jgi:hypothetical protein
MIGEAFALHVFLTDVGFRNMKLPLKVMLSSKSSYRTEHPFASV